ncbi:MAG: iron-containing alcohol dehydrogenase [Candidatus Micrarchaeota archaeon]
MRESLALKKPELITTRAPLGDILKNFFDDRALVLADTYNASRIGVRSSLVTSNSESQLGSLKNANRGKVIGIGGCTALDVARAVAGKGDELILVPTILSTPCISANISVLEGSQGELKIIETPFPSKVIVSTSAILDTDKASLVKWTQSGFADLFAKMSAAIEAGEEKRIPEMAAFVAAKWVSNDFSGFERSVVPLAKLLHRASLETAEHGIVMSGEHMLYLAMRSQGVAGPTHGQLVSVGTIATARIAAEKTGDSKLYWLLRDAYRRLGFPLTYPELEAIGITKQHIIDGLEAIRDGGTVLGNSFQSKGHKILDNVFKG